jgi:hypothetical protein
MLKVFLFTALASMAATPPATDFARPADIALQDSLNELEVCRSPNPADCWWPKRTYKVHDASCIPIAPEAGRPAIACRVDMTLTYEDPKRGYTRSHDWCGRFSKRSMQDNKPEWEVVQVRDRPCEIPSALKADPNPIPGRPELESAIIGMYRCYDPDGITHCVAGPDSAEVQSFQCKPIPPGGDYPVRVACRVTADVHRNIFRNKHRDHRFDNQCLRLDRITAGDESPAYWMVIYVPEESRCEV